MSNGTNSNTSGSDLAEVSFIGSGKDDPCVSDKAMEYIVENIVVKTTPIDSNLIGYVESVNEPDNKNVLWQKVDSQGNKVGSLKQYDFNTSTWKVVTDIDDIISQVLSQIPTVEIPEIPDIPEAKRCEIGQITATADSTVTQSLSNFSGVNSENIHVSFTKQADTAGDIPTVGEAYILGQVTQSRFRVRFDSIPPGEQLTINWMAIEC